jgi:hypothetical protein
MAAATGLRPSPVAESPDATFKFGLRGAELQSFGNAAEFGALPGADHFGLSTSPDHVGSYEQRVAPLTKRFLCRQNGSGFF